ncbi:hypothetical protein SKAU_G00197080 [Synaphobranchus kaupii]|uniref:Uncharacterized protein n=1 Tax=Synaphobranchus kaupii TaxID=118154 RepID=A0A9Q1FET9_SYNKA|nr:hypothetical protein SKAU_G00197080 [Synaphobranchus kaupii]
MDQCHSSDLGPSLDSMSAAKFSENAAQGACQRPLALCLCGLCPSLSGTHPWLRVGIATLGLGGSLPVCSHRIPTSEELIAASMTP